MARLSLGVMALLVAGLPARTWSVVPNLIELEPRHEGEEESTLSRAGPRRQLRTDDKEGRRKPRELDVDRDPTVEWIVTGRSHLGEADTPSQAVPEQAVSKRDYLNGLVEISAAATDDQEDNIAFVRTHKTGSATLAAILYRYAARHNLKLALMGKSSVVDLAKYAAKVQKGLSQRVDIMHYPISHTGRLGGNWLEAQKNYRGIMRDPDNINFITVMREPRSHLLSFYYYYLEPVNQLSIEDFLMSKPGGHLILGNPLSAEFGVTTAPEMDQLSVDGFSFFKLVLLTERFDEGLMVLRRLLGWSMIDMTYMTLLETKAGEKRWDNKPLVNAPSFEDLPEKVQNEIDDLTTLDQLLYTAAQVEYAKRLEPVSNVIQADLVAFHELQAVVSDYLDANDSSKANAMYRAATVYSGAPPLSPF